MRDENCIFCKIANGEIPSSTVYEDERFRAILDLGPASKGHTLILPKDHYDDLAAADGETLSSVLKVAQKICAGMKKSLNCDGINVVQNNGAAAGQTVKHLHFHILGGRSMQWPPG